LITFFPEPYEDELLYSVIARYQIRSGNVDAKSTLREVFGCTSVTAGIELPANIDTLLNSLPKSFSVTANSLIYSNTLYPFYTAFLTKEKADEIYNLMLTSNGSRIYNTLGASNKPIKRNPYLRFCPKCAEEDFIKYGETYWHRIHQIPGLIICNKHKEPIINNNITSRLQNRQEYINATKEIETMFKNIQEKGEVFEVNSKHNHILEKSLVLGRDIEFLLNNTIANKDLNEFRDIYVSRLIEMGLASRISLIHQDELLKSFKSYYGDEFLNLTQCNFDVNNSNWITTISRKHRKGFHPIQHLLFMQFLGLSAEKIFSDKIEIFSINRKSYRPKTQVEKNTYRDKWLNIIKDNPNRSKTDIKKDNVAVYTWLYRHDSGWLKENCPKRKVGIRSAKLVDWDKRDKEILEQVREQVRKIYEYRGKPQRITVWRIGININKLTLLQKHLHRLPKTKEYLLTYIESVEDIQVRRIKWAIQELSKSGRLKIWEVVRKAGLNEKDSKKYNELISELIRKEEKY
jgi:hypothetical protein